MGGGMASCMDKKRTRCITPYGPSGKNKMPCGLRLEKRVEKGSGNTGERSSAEERESREKVRIR